MVNDGLESLGFVVKFGCTMNYPQVRFYLNQELDKKMAIEFLGLNYGGINFASGILNTHPKIKKLIFDYIDNFYKKNKEELEKTTDDFEKQWRLNEIKFFETTSKIFKNHPWPKGKYIGYVSIFDCNPRFLENKTFQVFYKHKMGPVYVTAHELLHFIFYDYVMKKRKNLNQKLNEEKLWRISEIVNEILFALPPLKDVINVKKKIEGYPEFKNSVKRIKNKIKKVKDIDQLIDLSLNL